MSSLWRGIFLRPATLYLVQPFLDLDEKIVTKFGALKGKVLLVAEDKKGRKCSLNLLFYVWQLNKKRQHSQYLSTVVL